MRKLGAQTLRYYQGRIINIHPALLPKYGGEGMYGIRVHQAVLATREKMTGVTIHLVDKDYDHGAIIAQSRVPVLPDDTADILANRVLEQEHKLLVETIGKITTGEISLFKTNKCFPWLTLSLDAAALLPKVSWQAVPAAGCLAIHWRARSSPLTHLLALLMRYWTKPCVGRALTA
jgi:methionyl-tRNA formyltransferase